MALHHVRATISVGQAHITLVPIARSAIYVAIPDEPLDQVVIGEPLLLGRITSTLTGVDVQGVPNHIHPTPTNSQAARATITGMPRNLANITGDIEGHLPLLIQFLAACARWPVWAGTDW